MTKKKLEIIELHLGINVDGIDDPPKLHPETKKNIDRAVRLAKQETDAIKRLQNKRKKQQEAKNKAVESCFKMLLKATEEDKKVPASKLLGSSDMSLSILIQKINRLIQKRGSLWKVRKVQQLGEKMYDLTST